MCMRIHARWIRKCRDIRSRTLNRKMNSDRWNVKISRHFIFVIAGIAWPSAFSVRSGMNVQKSERKNEIGMNEAKGMKCAVIKQQKCPSICIEPITNDGKCALYENVMMNLLNLAETRYRSPCSALRFGFFGRSLLCFCAKVQKETIEEMPRGPSAPKRSLRERKGRRIN